MLTDEQRAKFREVALAVIACDNKNHEADDYDDATKMLNQLWRSLSSEEFDQFATIVQMAGESEFRCPK